MNAKNPTLVPRQPQLILVVCPQPGAVVVRRRLTPTGPHAGVQVGAVGARLLCRLRAYEQAASFQVGSGILKTVIAGASVSVQHDSSTMSTSTSVQGRQAGNPTTYRQAHRPAGRQAYLQSGRV